MSKLFDFVFVVKEFTKHVVEPDGLSTLIKVGGPPAIDAEIATILVPLCGVVTVLDLGLAKPPELICVNGALHFFVRLVDNLLDIEEVERGLVGTLGINGTEEVAST